MIGATAIAAESPQKRNAINNGTGLAEDDGAGIPADTLAVLFSIKPGQPRVGLGLAMVREVVAAHSGHLEIQSETHSFRAGTTIRITLPV